MIPTMDLSQWQLPAEMRGKVEKLLRLAINPNSQEGHAAFVKATQLLEQYGQPVSALGAQNTSYQDRVREESWDGGRAGDRYPAAVALCRECGGQIIWAQTDHGRNMPVDPDPADDPEAEDLVYRLWRDRSSGSLRVSYVPPCQRRGGLPLYWSHFDWCERR